MKKITFLIACLLAVFGMSAINHYDNLYVVGDACAAGWSPKDALEMTKVGDGQFTWTGELLDKTGDRRFKFLVGRGWDPCLAPNPDVPDHEIVTPGVPAKLYDKGEHGGYDTSFQVEKTGVYTITIDLDAETMTLTESSLDILDVEKFGQAYLAGSAFPERVAMTKEANGVYTWKGKLEVGEPVTGFYIVSNDNSQSLNPANASEVKSGSYAPVFSADEVATAEYQIASTATYTITIDLNTVKMEVTKIDYDHLYLIGSAMKGEPGAWKTEDGVEMTRVSEGVFTWNGFLYAKNSEGGDTEFKFINQLIAGNWENCFVFDQTQEGNQLITLGETYTISYFTAGNHDNKFTVPSDGYYKLTVDLNALTLLVEQGDPTAIEEVSAAVKPVVTVSGSTIQVLTNGAVVDDVMVFDLLGNCVASTVADSDCSFDMAHGGVYVVRINCGNAVYSNKVIVK
jgi:hypothetical protein